MAHSPADTDLEIEPVTHSEQRRYRQAIRRWGNSLALRLPADCLRQAGLREGDELEICIEPDGRLRLKPVRHLDRQALVADLRQFHASLPTTPSVMEECRDGERW